MIFKSVTLFFYFSHLISTAVQFYGSTTFTPWLVLAENLIVIHRGSTGFQAAIASTPISPTRWRKNMEKKGHQLTSSPAIAIIINVPIATARSVRSVSGSQAHRYVARSTWWWVNHHHCLVPSKSLGFFWGIGISMATDFIKGMQLDSDTYRILGLGLHGAPWFSDANTSNILKKKGNMSDFYPTSSANLMSKSQLLIKPSATGPSRQSNTSRGPARAGQVAGSIRCGLSDWMTIWLFKLHSHGKSPCY